MASDELTKSIEETHRIMRMQSDMLDALMKALTCIAHEKPSQPSVVAATALENYGRILEQYKAKKAEVA